MKKQRKKYYQKPNIKCGQPVKDELDNIGNKGERYEDIISRLIKFYKKYKK